MSLIHHLHIPQNHPPINPTRAKLAHPPRLALIHPNSIDRILMHRRELGVVLGGALEIHLPEHVERRVFAPAHARARFCCFEGAGELPA